MAKVYMTLYSCDDCSANITTELATLSKCPNCGSERIMKSGGYIDLQEVKNENN
jgi:DNA-directed RNA polymerase subunit RPC12/RpoP